MICHPSTSCCPLAVEMRRQKVRASHPIHNRAEEPRPCRAKDAQLLASLLEAEEDAVLQLKETTECLALIRTEIAIRRDEDPEQKQELPLGFA